MDNLEGFSSERGLDPLTVSAQLTSSATAEASIPTAAAGSSSAPSAAGNAVQSTDGRMASNSVEPRRILLRRGAPLPSGGSSGSPQPSSTTPIQVGGPKSSVSGRPPSTARTSQPSGANRPARPTVRCPVRTPAMPQGRDRQTGREPQRPVGRTIPVWGEVDPDTGIGYYMPVADPSMPFYQSQPQPQISPAFVADPGMPFYQPHIGPVFQQPPYGPNMMMPATHLPDWRSVEPYVPQWQSPFFYQYPPPFGATSQPREANMMMGGNYLQPGIHEQPWVNTVYTTGETSDTYNCYQPTVEQGAFPDGISQVAPVFRPSGVGETVGADGRPHTNTSTRQMQPVQDTRGGGNEYRPNSHESSTSEESTSEEIDYPPYVLEPR